MSVVVLDFEKEKRKRFERYSLELELLERLKADFLEDEVCLFDDCECETVLGYGTQTPFSLSARGIFPSFYGTCYIDLSCSGKGYVDFNYCFQNPNLIRCKNDFPKEHFRLSFGDGDSAQKTFEDYLKLFTLTGKIGLPQECSCRPGGYCAELLELKTHFMQKIIKGIA